MRTFADMPLPNETLRTVLDFLSRTDAVALVLFSNSRKMRRIVNANNAGAPRRSIQALTLCNNTGFYLATTDSAGSPRSYEFALEDSRGSGAN